MHSQDVRAERKPSAPGRNLQTLRTAALPSAYRSSLNTFQRALGNQAMQRQFNTIPLQTKLTVNQPGDIYEQEADRVADQVMRMTDPAVPSHEVPTAITTYRPAQVQRQASDMPSAESDTDAPEEEEEPTVEEVLQTKSLDDGRCPEPAPLADTLQRRRGHGQPLPIATRNWMEERFGADFGRVQIHNDSEAAWMNSALGARAFTHGHDIYFQQGEYHPAAPHGQRLLAHELTHVLQQTGQVMRQPSVTLQPRVNLRAYAAIQRSQALYFSTHGRQGYFRYATRFHREHGFPPPVEVSSVEEMLAHMVTLSRPIQYVRLVTHAVPDGIFLPLLRGGGSSLFAQDMQLQSMAALERELALAHPTVRQGGQLQVVTQNYHFVPRDWVRQAWVEINHTRGGGDVLIEHILLLGDAPDPDRGPITDLEMHSLFWWLLERELVMAQGEHTEARGRQRTGYLLDLPADQRQTLHQTFDRNFTLFRDRLIATRWGTRPAFDRLEAVLVQVAPRIFKRELARGIQGQFTLPDARYGEIQGAIGRGAYADNLIRVKYSIADGAPFEIRGCRIGQNVSWLETFRDFLGHGQESQRSRPDVSAPNLRHAFGIRTRREGRRRTTESAEWLQDGRRSINGGTQEFAEHIVHVR